MGGGSERLTWSALNVGDTEPALSLFQLDGLALNGTSLSSKGVRVSHLGGVIETRLWRPRCRCPWGVVKGYTDG